ncbi:hypothetical protein BC939DRAFT_527441 [Gamsiella multidivaricata]|uniref:uncharacterized protein n=1 Tax=Gamsiella multidivaricata TaxID=101098 RepID=UPI002220FCA6|nr:uncharacterized protein BC939DRAFT_527441 [Gamsiella multidivaricata]KAI7826892.1 hypothetical protein BC939DRAFT_527441 [Gamsiella multidivaricata]
MASVGPGPHSVLPTIFERLVSRYRCSSTIHQVLLPEIAALLVGTVGSDKDVTLHGGLVCGGGGDISLLLAAAIVVRVADIGYEFNSFVHVDLFARELAVEDVQLRVYDFTSKLQLLAEVGHKVVLLGQGEELIQCSELPSHEYGTRFDGECHAERSDDRSTFNDLAVGTGAFEKDGQGQASDASSCN